MTAPGRDPWEEEFRWGSIQRVGFKAEGVGVSDGIYLFTTLRAESYVIPTEAEGGSDLWAEIIRRGLFDAELAAQAMSASGGVFFWPPDAD